jgi:uncharacterized protein (TIGR02588 family)
MAVSIPDPSDAAPDPWTAGRADAPDQPTERSSERAPGATDDQLPATARRDALRGGSSEGRDAATGPHSAAEWITLAFSSLIVLGLIGLTSYFYLTASDAPAAAEVELHLAATYQAGSRYYLPVTVRNTGGETGEDVRVRVSLTDPSGRTEAAEIAIQFLAGGGSGRAVAAFGSDPRRGQLEAAVVSYLVP